MTGLDLPLVIGIGNPLRRDDGVGWRLAAEWDLLQKPPSRARLLAVQQVLPELAETLGHHRRVLFIDAAIADAAIGAAQPGPAGSGPWLLPLEPDRDRSNGLAFSHTLEPGRLLALAEELYGVCPSAQRLLLLAHRLDHGTGYSAALRRQLPAARALLQRWLENGDA